MKIRNNTPKFDNYFLRKRSITFISLKLLLFPASTLLTCPIQKKKKKNRNKYDYEIGVNLSKCY